jgi:hypothetical protein
MPVILATWEAEIGKMVVPGQTREKFVRTHLSWKKLDMGSITGGSKCKAPSSKNCTVCMWMDWIGEHYVKRSKPGSKSQRLHVFPIYGRYSYKINVHINTYMILYT